MTNSLTISLNMVLLITVMLLLFAVPVMAKSHDSGVIFVVTNPDGRANFKGAPLHTDAVDPNNQTLLIASGQRVRVEGQVDDGTYLVTVIDLPEDIGRGTIDGKYLTTIGGKATFRDVPDSHWAASAIASLAKDGIIQGYKNNFMGQKSFTRYEMAVIIVPLLKQFREMQDTLHQLQTSGTFVAPSGGNGNTQHKARNNNEIQIGLLTASIGKLQSQVKKQNNRLQILEEKKMISQTGSSKENVSVLRQDLKRLEDSLMDLQETVTDLDQPQQNNSKSSLARQVAANTKVITNVLVKSSVNDARIDDLDELGRSYRQLIGQLNTNSKIIANVLIKSSVNDVKVKEIDKITTDFSQLVKRLNANSKVLANVMIKTSVNHASIKELQRQ